MHRHLGPGLLESTYGACLTWELRARGAMVAREVALPVLYKGARIETGYRMDLLVDDQVVVELKTVDKILPIHHAQLLTYLKLTGLRRGLLLNFNVYSLRDGVRRVVL